MSSDEVKTIHSLDIIVSLVIHGFRMQETYFSSEQKYKKLIFNCLKKTVFNGKR